MEVTVKSLWVQRCQMAVHMRWVGRVWKTIGMTAEHLRVGNDKERDYLSTAPERPLSPGGILRLARRFRLVTTDALSSSAVARADL